MPRYLVSVPASVRVTVQSESLSAITEDAVAAAILDEHGKYVTLDARTDLGIEEFVVLETLDG